MFAWKQKAFSIPTRNELNSIWLRARKKAGTAERIYIPLNSSVNDFAELSVQCYRSSTQPKWQFQPQNTDDDFSRALISSDLSTVSAWISECLTTLRVVDFEPRRQKIDSTIEATGSFTFANLYTEDPVLINENAQRQSKFAVESFHWRGLINSAKWVKYGPLAAVKIRSQPSANGGQIVHAELAAAELPHARLPNPKLSIKRSFDLECGTLPGFTDKRLACLKGDADFSMVSVKRKRKRYSQNNLNRKIKRSGSHTQIVYCLELLKLLESDSNLAALQERSEIPQDSLLSAASILHRLGYIEVKKTEPDNFNSKNLLNFAPDKNDRAVDPHTSKQNAISFILIESQLGSTNRKLLALVQEMKSPADTVSIAGEDQILLVMRKSKSTDAAHFVRRLRNAVAHNHAPGRAQKTGLPDQKNVGNGGSPIDSTLFLSSIVSAPEDGVAVSQLLGKARLSLQVDRRPGKGEAAYVPDSALSDLFRPGAFAVVPPGAV